MEKVKGGGGSSSREGPTFKGYSIGGNILVLMDFLGNELPQAIEKRNVSGISKENLPTTATTIAEIHITQGAYRSYVI